jgi:hypothetical protein
VVSRRKRGISARSSDAAQAPQQIRAPRAFKRRSNSGRSVVPRRKRGSGFGTPVEPTELRRPEISAADSRPPRRPHARKTPQQIHSPRPSVLNELLPETSPEIRPAVFDPGGLRNRRC